MSDITEQYENQFPLLKAYKKVVREHLPQRTSLTQEPVGKGMDTRELAFLALREMGYDPDGLQIEMGDAYISRLLREMDEQRTKDAGDLLLSHFVGLMGRLPTAEEWKAEPEIEQEACAEYLMDVASKEQLRELVRHGIPVVIQNLIDTYDR